VDERLKGFAKTISRVAMSNQQKLKRCTSRTGSSLQKAGSGLNNKGVCKNNFKDCKEQSRRVKKVLKQDWVIFAESRGRRKL
jgi:hypothetical protein